MGRPKGSTNKTDEAKAFVARIEKLLKKSGIKENESLERLACRFITGEDIKTGFGVWRTLLNYKYGMPSQPLEHSGTISLSDAIEKARKRADG